MLSVKLKRSITRQSKIDVINGQAEMLTSDWTNVVVGGMLCDVVVVEVRAEGQVSGVCQEQQWEIYYLKLIT